MKSLGLSLLFSSASFASVLYPKIECDNLVSGTGAGLNFIQTADSELIEKVREVAASEIKFSGVVRIEEFNGIANLVVGFRGGFVDRPGEYFDLPEGLANDFFLEGNTATLTLRGGKERNPETHETLLAKEFTNCQYIK